METEATLIGLGERIRRIRTEIAKQSQEEFALLMCMTQSNLSLIETQKILPSCLLLYRLQQTYAINLNWVLTGIGAMML